MNKIQLVIMTLIALTTSSFAQEKKSCCQAPSATTSFASLGGNTGFMGAHVSPLAISYAAKGNMITFPTPDGKTGSAYFVPAASKSDNYIFVFQEWWGLNDHIKRQADLYSDSLKNVNVIAVDLYDGKVTSNAEEAGKIMQSIDDARARSIITGALNHAGKNAKIATVGWCFGGGWSLQAAIMGAKQTKGCVMYYGMPEKDLNKLKTLNSDVIFFFAKKDQWINEEVKNEFVKNMKAAGKKLTVKEYDADHAFANPSNPDYKQAFAADAQKITLSYFKSIFK